MTGTLSRCVAIARPNAPLIPGTTPTETHVPGTPGLRFRTIAGMIAPTRHDGKDTANAVGWQHPPGFKSPILRSSRAPPRRRATERVGRRSS